MHGTGTLLLSVIATFILVPLSASAQAGTTAPGSGMVIGRAPGADSPRHPPAPGRGQFVIPFYPLGYYEPYSETVIRVVPDTPAKPVAPVEEAHTPELLPGARIIEIPESRRDRTPHLPTIFIFTDGHRIEVERFLLTADTLSVSTGPREEKYPLTSLNLAATLAVNRERGVNLHIPVDPNHIFVSF